jgi:hypothetical protein
MLRSRSENAIGYLKGRFQSLKDLRVLITDERSHKFATYWIAACINVHSFAMGVEAEENGGYDSDDSFIAEGLADSDSDEDLQPPPPRQTATRSNTLNEGKQWREKLKQALFASLD